MQRFVDLGLDVRVSELDVRIDDDAEAPILETQAEMYRQVIATCLAMPRCTSLTTWGFTDKFSWVPASFTGAGRALPIR